MSVMRASDQDREEAILALSDHFADGRLDHAEFEVRMARAQEATYVHELDPLFADLPARKQDAVPTGQQSDDAVYVKAVPGTDLTALRAELVTVAKPYLVVSVQDRQEFTDATGTSVDTRLNLLYVLLLFSVIVAILGIVNTLALSVVERTREIGLLRAVGLRRRQLSEMITIEAIATAVFGAVLGTVLGLGLGVALQHGLISQGVDTLAVSWPMVTTMIIASGVVGVLAAVLPSLRAVRLDILTAIATDG